MIHRRRWALLLVAVAACDPGPAGPEDDVEDRGFPWLHGTYEGGLMLSALVGAGAHLGAYCGGPATITIVSTDEGQIVGGWEMGPTYHLRAAPPPNSYPICPEGEHFGGALGGSVVEDSLVLSFDYVGTDMISGITGWEAVGGGPPNEWFARYEDGAIALEFEYERWRDGIYPNFSHPDSTRFWPWVVRFPFGPFSIGPPGIYGGAAPQKAHISVQDGEQLR